MSSDEERDVDLEAVSTPSGIKQYIIGLENRLEAHSLQLDELREENDDLRAKMEMMEARNERLRDRNDELEEEINRLDARTDLLQAIENSDGMGGKQRSISLILSLKKKAEKLERRGQDGLARAEYTPEEAENALNHPDIDRTTIYSDMRRAVRLVGNKDVLWYESGYNESKLKLDLEAGEVPRSILGRE